MARIFFRGLPYFLSCLILLVSIPGVSHAATVLKLAHAESTTGTFHAGAVKFKEEVERLTNGSVEVRIFPSNQLGSLREILEGIQMGNVDFAITTSSFVATFCPDVYVFDLPFLMDDYEHAYRAMDGSVGEHLNAELEKVGIVSLGWFQNGFRNITSNKDIDSVETLKGNRIRIMPSNIFRDMFLALDVDPVPMNWEELFTAMQQGTVDGQENPYAVIEDTRFYEVQKYLVESEHVFSPALLSISPVAAAKLSGEQMAAVREAGKTATAAQRKVAMDRIESAKKALVETHGMQFRTLDKNVLREKVKSVYAKYPEYAKLVEMVQSYRK